MSLEHAALAAAVSAHGPVVRVVIAEVRGSAPREVGAAMLVWPDGQDGTIGGGTLEYEAAKAAREMLAGGPSRRFHKALLGPDLGQCCGGAVGLLSEIWDAEEVAALEAVHARPIGQDGATPLVVQRLLSAARAGGETPGAQLVDGWFVEPVAQARAPVWIWGAGHVGRALISTLAPLPGIALTWVDTAPERFPEAVPAGVTVLPAPEIAAAVVLAPRDAQHLVLTYSHALDLALCDALLRHDFAGAGLIGSATKWARFRSRLGQMGHTGDAIGRIACPIGAKELGKHPSAIAVGVAYALLMELAKKEAECPKPGEQGTGNDRRAADA